MLHCFSNLPRRTWITGVCITASLSFGISVTYARSVVSSPQIAWPEPQVAQPVSTPVQTPVRVVPNFRAPSATSCQRAPVMREIPGGQNLAIQREYGRERAVTRSASSGIDDERVSALRSESSVGSHDKLEMDYAPVMEAPKPAEPVRAASMPGDTPVVTGAREPVSQQRQTPVTAGMVDDNANFGEYLAYLKRNAQVAHRPRDISERHLLQVRDDRGRSVPDAEVAIISPEGYAMWARTDAGGRVWVHPNAFDARKVSSSYQVYVRKGDRQVVGVLQRNDRSAVEVVLPSVPIAQRVQLDLVFLVDSTGSMGDEIDKLSSSLQSIVAEISNKGEIDLCLGVVTYRDKGDAYLVRSYDMTNDVNAFQKVLNGLRAGGGGDEAEAMNEAFYETVHNLSWRGSDTTRLIVSLADAPPHLDYGGPQYDNEMIAALGMGIKVMSVGASGLNPQGEFIQRQIAQYTGGRFVFLTYDDARNPASGPGRETVHDVSNYSVQTLDNLIVRLVRDELALLPNSK